MGAAALGDAVKQRERDVGEAPSAVAAALEGAKGMANYFLGAAPEGQDHFIFAPVDGRIPELRLGVSAHCLSSRQGALVI